MSHLLRAVRPIALDFASTITFVAAFSIVHSLPAAIGASVAIGLGQIAWQTWRGKAADLMQWASLALAVTLGGAALLTHDPRFVLFKPTAIYVAIGCVMLRPGWMERYAPPIAVENLGASVLSNWGYVWAGLMFVTAALNLALALHGDLKLWTAFIAVWPLASKLALFAIQYPTMRLQVKRRLVGAHTGVQAA